MTRGVWMYGFAGAIALAVLPPARASDEGEATEGDACERCEPVVAVWPWKANGYAIGATVEEAHQAARTAARDSACEQAAKYLDGRDLSCKAGCEDGEIEEGCEVQKSVPCLKGSAEDDAGMWRFICLKDKGDTAACGEEAREKEPFYAMCDLKVKAEKTLSCRHPECDGD